MGCPKSPKWESEGEASSEDESVSSTASQKGNMFRGIRCAALWEVFLRNGPANPSEVGVYFSAFFAALNLAVIDTVMGHVNVHIDCKLFRVAVPSQLSVSLHAWPLPRRFKNASKLWRRCSTPQHAQHARPHAYIPTSPTGTPTQQHTTKTITHQPQHGGRRRFAWRPCPECQIDMPRRPRVAVRSGQPSQRRAGLRGPTKARPTRRAGGQQCGK